MITRTGTDGWKTTVHTERPFSTTKTTVNFLVTEKQLDKSGFVIGILPVTGPIETGAVFARKGFYGMRLSRVQICQRRSAIAAIAAATTAILSLSSTTQVLKR